MFKGLQRNAIGHLISVMWKHAQGYRGWVIVYSSMSCAALAVGLYIPLVMAKLMNAAQSLSGDELLYRAEYFLSIYVLLGIGFWVLHGPSRVIETQIAFLVRRAFQTSLFQKVTSLPISWQKDHHSGKTIDQIARATQALADFSETGFEVIHLVARFIGSMLILTWLMPIAGLIVVAVAIAISIVIMLFDRRLIQQYAGLNKQFNDVAAAVQDYLTNISTVISLRLEKRVSREVFERTTKIYPLVRRNTRTNELKWFTTARFVDLLQATLLLGFIAVSVKAHKSFEIGTLYALSEYLRGIGESFFQFTGKYGDLVMKSTRVHAIDHIEEMFDREVKATEKAGLEPNWRRVEIRDLNFSHVEHEYGVSGHLSNISLVLEKGRSYALVGESGSGKSTLLGILRGLNSPQTGSVICDGIKQPFGLVHIAHHTTLIPQDPEIFSDTIRFNITMGVESEESAVLEAIRLARFEAVLSRLSKGLDTNIAEKGVNLSGGEKQRLALARGLFFVNDSGSDIILLDESTSSVDIFNERIIYETLLKKYKDRCIVSAIHKFNLLGVFDEILVFSGGRIVERGDIAQLLSIKGEFFRLWEAYSQSSSAQALTG